jgi:hypothetical protein
MANPITWADMNYAKKIRVEIRFDENGDEVLDKYPMTAPAPEGHPLHKRRFVRWISMVDSSGNVLRPVLTEASSNYDLNSSYSQYMRARWRNEGWLPYGECPKALALTNAVALKHLLPTNRNGTPCERGTFDNGEGRNPKGPCPCMRAEIESRRARNVKEEQRRAKRYESELARESKQQTEAAISQAGSMQAMVEQQAAQNKALTDAMLALAGMSKKPAKKTKKASDHVEAELDEVDAGEEVQEDAEE